MKNRLSWFWAGVFLAVLNLVVFAGAVTNRPIGASTMYPYLADWLAGLKSNAYFLKIQTPGHWEMIFLLGAFLAGLAASLVFGDFRLTSIHKRWKERKGGSSAARLLWAFIGGFILIFGARMAGGCTSGHIFSGGMQMAISSLVFGLFVVVGLIVTGKIFYKK